MIKKTCFLYIFIIALFLVNNTYALVGNQLQQNLREVNQGEVNELKNQVRDTLQEKIASMPGWLRIFKNNRIAFGNGELTEINGNSLTVVRENVSYTILVDEKSQIRRKFWGKSELTEFTIGDKLNVIGVWEDEAKTTIRARFIRNLSIQMRHGVFFGTIIEKTDIGFTMDTIRRGRQIVTVREDTKYKNRSQKDIQFADILIGHRVRVRGLWNSKNSTITEVTQVKDFSLPEIAKPTEKPEEV